MKPSGSLLGKSGLMVDAKHNAASAPASELAGRLLTEMNFVSQFAALRELHRANRLNGESADGLAALARGYANLGLLSG